MDDSTQDNRPRLIWLYDDIIRKMGSELGVYAISTYCALASLANDVGQSYPAIKTIAGMIGTSETSVKTALKTLSDHHLITITPRYKEDSKQRDSNLYTLLPLEVGQNATQGGSECDQEVVMKMIKRKYNEVFALYPTPFVEDKLVGMVSEYGGEWVQEAIEQAGIHNARNLAYVQTVLGNWKAGGKNNKPSKSKARSGGSDIGDLIA